MKKKIALLIVISLHISIVNAQWGLTGNSGTNPPVNFLGTTDSKNLVFKVNNNISGIIDLTHSNTGFGYYTFNSNTNGSNNSAFGAYSLTNNNTGAYNSASGYASLYNNSNGNYNTSQGYNALWANTSGSFNTASGAYALQSSNTGDGNTGHGYASLFYNTTGFYNTAQGYNALWANTTGYYNVANGANTLKNNLTGNNNAASGFSSLFSNLIGNSNSGLGNYSLYSNTNGYSNVGIGVAALYYNTAGSNLVAVGDSALFYSPPYSGFANTGIGSKALFNGGGVANTATGFQSLYTNDAGVNNTANGYQSLYSNGSGYRNTAVGYQSLYSNTYGNNNVAVGYQSLYSNVPTNSFNASSNSALGNSSLYSNTTGLGNTAVGFNALYTNTIGGVNTALGLGADVNANNFSNTTVLGVNALGTASNQVRIGDISVTSIGGYANWTNISDGRVKKNIQANVPGLAFINKLKPVTYNLDLDAADKIVQRSTIKDKDGNILQPTTTELTARTQKQQIIYSGFIAQDVEKIAKDLKFDFSGVDAPKNNKDLYGLRYAEFVVPLVKAVQELSSANDSLKAQLKNLQTQIDGILKQLNPSTTASLSNNTSSYLEQNAPNPFTNKTVIKYHISSATTNSQIAVFDTNGKIIKSVSITDKGAGQTILNAGELAAGVYFYTLISDGQKVDTKQMIIFK